MEGFNDVMQEALEAARKDLGETPETQQVTVIETFKEIAASMGGDLNDPQFYIGIITFSAWIGVSAMSALEDESPGEAEWKRTLQALCSLMAETTAMIHDRHVNAEELKRRVNGE